jgi:hypothetical protein
MPGESLLQVRRQALLEKGRPAGEVIPTSFATGRVLWKDEATRPESSSESSQKHFRISEGSGCRACWHLDAAM